mgnify:CR=1 FL=1
MSAVPSSGALLQPTANAKPIPTNRFVEFSFILYGLDVLNLIEVSSPHGFEDSLYSDTQLCLDILIANISFAECWNHFDSEF